MGGDGLYRAGVGLGYAFARFFQGLRAGVEDFELEQAAENLADGNCHEKERGKTNLADCQACWCDRCALIDRCQRHRDGEQGDAQTPNPCAGCEDGMRFFPVERKPCPDFKEGNGFNHG